MINNVSQIKKEFLENKINKITDKYTLCYILKIIKDNNPDIEINYSTNGMIINFNNLTDKTYKDLEDYLNSNETINNESDKIKSYKSYGNQNANLQHYNTEEKSIINHQKYIKNIKNNQK